MQMTKPSVELLFMTPKAALLLEDAGRTCYKSEDKISPGSAAKFVKMLIHEKNHESVIEHAYASFRIVCDRGCSHELVRHRIASYSQESTRYCNYGKDKFGAEIKVIPLLDKLTESQIERRNALYKHCEEVYLAELSEGIAPEQARDNLPTCLKTEVVMTCNFREWRHFLKLRTAPGAHPQMRIVADIIRRLLVNGCPEVFGDFDTPA